MSTARWLVWLALPVCVCGQQATAPKLGEVRRVCVDRFVGEEALTGAVREIASASLFALKRFRVTDNCTRADAVLKGAVLERSTKRVRGEGETTGFGKTAGAVAADRSGVVGAVVGASGLADEQLYSSESGSAASITLRLVTTDGDVLWAYTQDSPGGKTKGAVADAVERAVKQLEREVNRAQQKTP